MKLFVLLATLPLAAQIDMRMEVRMQSPQMALLSSSRFVFQDNILRIENGPSFLINNIAEGKYYLGNAADKTYVEATQAEFEQLGRKAPAGTPPAVNFTKLEAPAAPLHEWNGQKLQGKACRYKIDFPNGPASSFEQTIIVHGTALGGDLAKLQAAQRRAGFEPPTPGADSFAFAVKDCFASELFPVRTEVKTVMPQLNVETVMVIEVASVRRGPVDPALLQIPTGWARDTTTTLRSALDRLSRASPPSLTRQAEKAVTKETVLASIDELKRLVESESWPDASRRASQLSAEIFRNAEASKPPLSKQLEDIETKIPSSNGASRALLMAQAAEMALQAGLLDKVRTHAQALIDDLPQRPGMIDDELHRAHTLLGLLAMKSGDKDAALAHLDRAGKAGSRNFFGPRTELAEQLAAAGERSKVADYLDAVATKVRDENKRTMYQTAAKNLRAGQPAFFSPERYDKYELPK